MSDVYGSNLSFGSPESSGGPSLTDNPTAPAPIPGNAFTPIVEPEQPGPTPGPTFGGSLRNILPGPHYSQPDPQTAPLDQSADLLQQRIKRAGEVATNPILQLFAPEQAAAARQFVPQATEQLQKIETQRSAVQSGRVQARQLGLDPGEVSDQATMEDRLIVASNKALAGNLKAFQGIQAVSPERAAAIAPQVYEKVGAHLDTAKFAFDSLASMQNEGQYNAKVNELRRDGKLADLEALGLKVPSSYDAFNANKASEARALRTARIGIDTVRQQLEERNTYQPMEEKEAKTYHGRLATVYGDQVTNGTWGRNAASGTRGLIVNGAADPNDLGKKFTLATPEQRKEIKEEFAQAVPKEEFEKFRAFNRTYKLATEDAKGNPMPADKINTNPNVQQGVAEGLASMLRGGSGGANVGLLKIELEKRGWAQSAIDGLVSNYAGTMNTLFKNADKPYLSQQTQKQIRDVMDVLKTYNDTSISDRASQIAGRAGALGLDSAALGFGKNEASGPVGAALEAGRQAQVDRMKPNHQAIGGGDGVLQLSAQRTGAGATALPPGTTNTNQLPQGGILTPVQQAGTQNAPPIPSPPGGNASPVPPTVTPGGAGTPPPAVVTQPLAPLPRGGTAPQPAAPQPVRIASADVNVPLPSGASPAYVQATQRIESGNERNPWTAGTKNSSAGGAFQIIDRTWAENKPAGAPARAKDATPQQQAEAFANSDEEKRSFVANQ
jgi:hypothetical protein